MPSTPSQEMIDDKVAVVRKRHPAYGEVVGWLGQLLGEAVKAQFAARPPAFTLTPEQTGEGFSAGRPLFSPEQIPLDLDSAGRLYARLVEMVGKRKAGREQAQGLAKAWAGGAGAPPRLLTAALAQDRPALEAGGEELGVSPQVLDMLLRLSARPSLLALAQAALEQVDLAQWTQGHCPVCGSQPRLAELFSEGGSRRLHCGLCETVWPFRRLRCPFCHNQDAEALVALTAEEEEGYRVDLCLRCGQHLKTLDLRALTGPVIPWLDDLATWHLDLAAQKHLEESRGQAAPGD